MKLKTFIYETGAWFSCLGLYKLAYLYGYVTIDSKASAVGSLVFGIVLMLVGDKE